MDANLGEGVEAEVGALEEESLHVLRPVLRPLELRPRVPHPLRFWYRV